MKLETNVNVTASTLAINTGSLNANLQIRMSLFIELSLYDIICNRFDLQIKTHLKNNVRVHLTNNTFISIYQNKQI